MNINPFDLLKNAQKIQEQMGAFQNKLSEITVTGSAGGGMVEIDLNGKFEVVSVRISAEAVNLSTNSGTEGSSDGVSGGSADTEMLEDLVMAALSSGLEKVREAINGEMGEMTGGLNIQGFPGMA